MAVAKVGPQKCQFKIPVPIKGGGRLIPLSSIGNFFESIKRDYDSNSNIRHLKVKVIEGKYFWTALNQWVGDFNPDSEFIKWKRLIKSGNYYPIVIVGHSLGAETAWQFAEEIPTTLLVTLDGVSYLNNWMKLPVINLFVKNEKPRSPLKTNAWINVYVGWGRGLASVLGDTAFGPNWWDEWHADLDYSIGGEYDHSDVDKMWFNKPYYKPYNISVASVVDSVLRKCER